MKTNIQTSPRFAWALSGLCGFATVYAISHYSWVQALRLFTLLLVGGLAFFYHAMLPFFAGRRAVFALFGGFVFALCQGIADVLLAAHSMLDIPLQVLGYWPLYTALLCGALQVLDARPAVLRTVLPQKAKALLARLLCGEAKPTLLLWGILILLWLPYHLLFWPGIVSPDTASQMRSAMGVEILTSHHPPFHTLWLGLCLRLGESLFGNHAAGVGIASGMQLVLLACLAAMALAFMARLGIGLAWRAGALLFYGLAPVCGWYAAILWKDVWLGAFGLLFALCCLGILRRRGSYFTSPLRIFLLALSILGTIISKNNGIYIVLFTALAFLLFLKGARRQMAAVLLASFLLFQGVSALYSAMGFQKGDLREALSLPLLQVALVLRDEPQSIAPEDMALLAAVLPQYAEMKTRYNAAVSDGVKSDFQTEVYRQNAAAYHALYLRLGLAHPKEYLRAVLDHTYAYYFPDSTFGWADTTPYTTFLRLFPQQSAGIDPLQGRYAEPTRPATEWLAENIGFERTIPGVALLFAPGFYFWLLLFGGLWVWYKRLYVRLLALAMPFGLWLTCLASPVNGSFRYAFPAVLATPLLLGYLLKTEPNR